MNERIKQLAEQADIHGDSYLLYQHRLEKFAELIVRECAKQVNGLYKQGGGTYGETILNHFKIKS
jgi:hypothetical protein